MQYIVLDMEWNQAWPGSYSAKRLPEKFRGEIIQIGAVRVTERQIVGDEFQALIQPKMIRKLNKRVSALTGIKESQLKEQGIPFPEAMEQFKDWCGDDCVFLTWGFDDIAILKENMDAYHLDSSWVDRWYNAQMIFNSQTDGSTSQKALKTAMEMAGVECSRPAHDALGDAYHTAILCTRLDLPRGMQEYGKSVQKHEDGFHGIVIPGCIERRVFHEFADKESAMQELGEAGNLCPKCRQHMERTSWASRPNRINYFFAGCPEHGKFLIRLRFFNEEDGSLKVVRMIYEGDSETAKAYEKPKTKAKVRRHKQRKKANETF